MKIKDYFLSQEEFEIKETNIEGHFQTTPIPKNIEKYYESDNYISHNKEKKTLFVRLYNILQNINLKYKTNILNKYIDKNSSVLDYGCGTGDFLKYIEKKYKTYGYEPNKNAQKILKTKINATLYSDVNLIQNESLDAITLWHVLEHIPNQKNMIDTFVSKLKKNGILIIAIPNHSSYDAKHYKQYWAAYDVPRHLHHYNLTAFDKFCKQNYLNIIKIKPLFFDAYYISLLSEKYQNSSCKLLKAIIIGTISNIKALKTKEFSSLIYIIQK